MKLRIKPKDGFTVRDPVSMKPLAAEGEEKEIGSYWQRRIDDGDVVRVPTTTTTAPKA